MLTTALAVWGAVVSTIAIVWNIRRDWADRGRIQVICYQGKIVGPAGPGGITYLVYRVTNVGRRDVVVTHIGGEVTDEEHFIVREPRTPLPHTLKPGDYLLEYHDISILDKSPQSLWACDSLTARGESPRSGSDSRS